MNKIFGVDVGGTTVKIGMFDENGTLEYKCEIPTDTTDNGKNILNDICNQLEFILKDNKLTNENCIGVGIGLPGPITADGTILECVNLGWGIFNVEEKMSGMLNGIPVKAGNDANVAALGEQKSGGGAGYDNVVMVTLGTGVGGGIILDGKVVTGTNGAAGEIGHIPVNPDETEKCSCGKCGCLEQYASATGIVRLAKKYIEKTKKDVFYGDFTAKDVMDKAKEGDELCLMVADELAKYMGMALASVASVVNPECFVIGGGVSRAGEFLTDIIEKNFMKYAFKPCRNVTFKLARLGNDAGIYGGAGMILDKIFKGDYNA